MKITAKTRRELVDLIEGVLDRCAAFDPLPFHIKREAAEIGAANITGYLEAIKIARALGRFE